MEWCCETMDLMRTCSYEWDEMLRWRGTKCRWSGKSWSPQILQRLEIKISCLVSGPFVDGGKYQLVKSERFKTRAA